MLLKSLRVRISACLALVLALAVVPFVLLVVQHDLAHLEEEVSRQAVQLTDMVAKSTRYAMLTNKRDVASKIIEDIGRQKGLERLRVISADGTIIHTNNDAEFGYSVEQQDRPCVNCHTSSKPLERVPDDHRWQIHATDNGSGRLLSVMQPIYNEPSCANASCHEHPASQKVLGVIDVAFSLNEIDKLRSKHTTYLMEFGLFFVLIVAASAALLLHWQIYRPLRDLEAGAEIIKDGNLDHDIPVRRRDELGRVASAFNHMREALKNARETEVELIQTLESKVEERSKELLVAQAEAAQGQKLASVGLLASGIAHELNNPLTGVLTFTSLLRKKMPDGSQDAEDLDLVIRETKRCASIIRRLLDFAREKVPVKGYFDLSALINETVRFVDRPASLQNIEIRVQLAPLLPPLWGDADLIKQVLLNLLVNAQQAISGAGRIDVQVKLHDAHVSPKPEAAPIQRVEICIRDTGCGIPETNLQRIFDPFFTSKEVGKGTGLGLSVSYGIIKAHGGEITVESEIDVGTTFHVHLPIASPETSHTKREPVK